MAYLTTFVFVLFLNYSGFVFHRIRESTREGELAVPFGSGGGGVEVDETYIGRLKGQPVRQSGAHKMKVVSSKRLTSRRPEERYA